jgi:hypothetical protein
LASRVIRTALHRRQLFLITLTVLLGLGTLLLGLTLSKHQKLRGKAWLLIIAGGAIIGPSIYKLAEALGLVGTPSIEEETHNRRTPADEYDSTSES